MEKGKRPFKRNRSWRNNLPGLPIDPSELAPEILKEWKNYILEFERQFQKKQTIKVYQRIGSPRFPSVEDLDASALRGELQRLLRLLDNYNMCISTLSHVEDRTLYQFITEELFDYEVEDVSIPGMKTQFCYEAFHPNHEYDLTHYTKDGLHDLLSLDDEYWMLGFQDHAFFSHNGDLLQPGAFVKKVLAFKACFEWFQIDELRDIKIEYNLEKERAGSSFFINYTACPVGSSVPLRYKGAGQLGFAYCCEDWFINKLAIPGFLV